MTETHEITSGTFNILGQIPGGWWLRWQFEYADGTKKNGGWNQDADDISLQAWRQKKEGILYARVQAMNPQTRVIQTAVETTGSDFCCFQWECAAKVTGFGKAQQQIIGMTLLTITEKVSFFRNGTAYIEVRSADDRDSDYHYGRN